jgi:hypothetical protein
MFCGMKMLGGMFVFRRIATAHVAADETKAEVDPGVAHFQALLAAFGIWLDLFDLIEVRADIGHGSLLGG